MAFNQATIGEWQVMLNGGWIRYRNAQRYVTIINRSGYYVVSRVIQWKDGRASVRDSEHFKYFEQAKAEANDVYDMLSD